MRTLSSIAAVFLITAVVLALPSASAADTNPASIAIPALGTQGVGTPYPSTVTIAAEAGPAHTSTVSVSLFGVTHPCPEDLAVLLVHNQTDGYLLMSNAGGCRPLQGTTLELNLGDPAMPDEQASAPAYQQYLGLRASNYGVQPMFPAPAPPGPYTLGLPPINTTNPNGTWDLYVIDTREGGRGVIAGGWSLNYNPRIRVWHNDIPLPGAGTSGPAATYPIEFDLTGVSPSAAVTDVDFTITLAHGRPDDLRLVLQSPAGTSVVLMANAGGAAPAPPGSVFYFYDSAPASVPDDGPFVSGGSYRPGGAYGSHDLPLPAPQPPYQTTLAALNGEMATGTWKLWAYDSTSPNAGEIEMARLNVSTVPRMQISVASPAGGGIIPWTRSFVPIEIQGNGLRDSDSATWRVTNGPGAEFYDAGALRRVPGTNRYVAEVPVKHGTNAIEFLFRNGVGVNNQLVTIGVDELTYSFAEGATGSFFDTDVTVANFGDPIVPLHLDFLPESGDPIVLDSDVGGNTSRQVQVDTIVPAAAVSTVVRSPSATPFAVERTMIWDARGYGGHGGTSADPATRWLFAEGSQGFFATYVLLANDNSAVAEVTLNFLLEGGGIVSHAIEVPARSRRTIYAGDIPGLVNQSFGLDVTSTVPIIAERAMYLPGARLFEGGHGSAGVNRPASRWFLAEGATGPFFDCFVLLSNPQAEAANVTLTYLLPDGTTIPHPVVVPANGRYTINVETVDPLLANTPVSTTVVSDRDIVVERAMYWPDISQGWQEAHNSFGMTETALRWGLADGRVGGARGFETYVLLANPNPTPAEVQVRFLKADGVIVQLFTVAPTSRLNVQASLVPGLGEGLFSVEVSVLNYQPIAVEKAMYWSSEGQIWAGGTNVTATRLPPP